LALNQEVVGSTPTVLAMSNVLIVPRYNYYPNQPDYIKSHIVDLVNRGITDVDEIARAIFTEHPDVIMTHLLHAMRELSRDGVLKREAYNLYWP
jgi:hypothetical protein